jgi:hypothetical protein
MSIIVKPTETELQTLRRRIGNAGVHHLDQETALALIDEVLESREAMRTAKEQIRAGRGRDWAVDTLRHALEGTQ